MAQISTGTESPSGGGELWGLVGLSKTDFYAAAFFLTRHQRQQERDEHPKKPRTERPMRELLDGLALLFARVKKHDTPAHVTATALQTIDEGHSRTLKFFIAKNRGPQQSHGRDDVTYCRELVSWINGGPQRQLSADSPMWKSTVDFWGERVAKYRATLRKIDIVALEKFVDGELKGVGRVNMKAFRIDLELLRSFVNDYHSTTPANDYTATFNIPEDVTDYKYTKFHRPRKGDRDQRTPDQRIAEEFRKAIKHLRLLTTPRKLLELFAKHVDESDVATTVEIDFLETQKETYLDVGPIADHLEMWKRDKSCSQDFSRDIEIVVKALREPLEQPRRKLAFHCELQILEHCIVSDHAKEFSDYIGCSKLSCFFCWYALKDADFQTKDSHFNLYADCEFAFRFSTNPGHLRLALAMKKVQARLMDLLLIYSMDPSHKLVRYAARTETDPDAASITEYGQPMGAWLSVPKDKNLTTSGGGDKLNFAILKVCQDGNIIVDRDRMFYRPEKLRRDIRDKTEQRQNRRNSQAAGCGNSQWRSGANPTRDDSWMIDLVLEPWSYPFLTSRLCELLSLNSNNDEDVFDSFESISVESDNHWHMAHWQWMRFKILVNEEENLYHEIQILCRLCGRDGKKLPVNVYCQNVANFSNFDLNMAPRYPWRGDLYVIGQKVVDEVDIIQSTQLEPLEADPDIASSELLMSFRNIITWTSDIAVGQGQEIFDTLKSAKQLTQPFSIPQNFAGRYWGPDIARAKWLEEGKPGTTSLRADISRAGLPWDETVYPSATPLISSL